MQASTTEHPGHLIDQILQASADRQPLRIVGGNTKSFLGVPTPGHFSLVSR